MNIDYTIGDDVVCIDASGGTLALKENEIYQVKGLNLSPCCNKPIADIGIRNSSIYRVCGYCNTKYEDISQSYIATRFKKLDTLVNISELTEHLENTVPFEL